MCPTNQRCLLLICADIDNSGFVSDFELQELFREASLSMPGYRVREIIETFIAGDTNKDEKISFEEFVSVRLKNPSHNYDKCTLALIRSNYYFQ